MKSTILKNVRARLNGQIQTITIDEQIQMGIEILRDNLKKKRIVKPRSFKTNTPFLSKLASQSARTKADHELMLRAHEIRIKREQETVFEPKIKLSVRQDELDESTKQKPDEFILTDHFDSEDYEVLALINKIIGGAQGSRVGRHSLNRVMVST